MSEILCGQVEYLHDVIVKYPAESGLNGLEHPGAVMRGEHEYSGGGARAVGERVLRPHLAGTHSNCYVPNRPRRAQQE